MTRTPNRVAQLVGAASLCIACTLIEITAYRQGRGPNISETILTLFLGSLAGLLATPFMMDIDPNLKKARSRINELQVNLGQAKEGKDFVTQLVELNFKYIDLYYEQTQIQAQQSFALSATAAVVSLVVVLMGIIMMYAGKTNQAYVTTGVGVLGEFVSAVFFYLYNRTILKMGEYHQKLVITQNVSLALKITEGMPEAERVRSQAELVKALSKDVNYYLSAVPKDSEP